MKKPCMGCSQIDLWRKGNNPYVVKEFDLSIWVVGFHQFYEGYSLLLLKRHIRELNDLTEKQEMLLYSELMIASRALVRTFKPWKMNYSCLGNTMEHLSWHLFPRYETDPNHARDPWVNRHLFREHELKSADARALIAKITPNIQNPDLKF